MGGAQPLEAKEGTLDSFQRDDTLVLGSIPLNPNLIFKKLQKRRRKEQSNFKSYIRSLYVQITSLKA